MRFLAAIVLVVLLAGLGAAAFVYSGAYDIGADAPHSPAVQRLLQIARQRAIAAHADSIAVPPLTDAHMIGEGAEHYAAMCAGCHLAPGKNETEIRRGLYPQPPKLAEGGDLPPAQAFWIVKHGIKLTAMPAWGTSHDDAEIWNIVAFLQKLPHMSAEEYGQLTAASGGHDHAHHEHEHGSAPDQDHEHAHDDAGQHEHGNAGPHSDDGADHAHGSAT